VRYYIFRGCGGRSLQRVTLQFINYGTVLSFSRGTIRRYTPMLHPRQRTLKCDAYGTIAVAMSIFRVVRRSHNHESFLLQKKF
jgi:hypothetical protein